MKQKLRAYLRSRFETVSKIEDQREKEDRLSELNNLAAAFEIKLK